ncbi:MAG: hypothetical protein H3C48_02570 [Chitinophagaceae bacterium]|nr:hypothetical protein [Chitinophagaceae bacterium]
MMPDMWRMSRKEGKAVLLNGKKRKETYVLSIPPFLVEDFGKVAETCPARVIKVN